MISVFPGTLSTMTQKHIPLSDTRRETRKTLGWLILLIMRHGTVSLWRLAAHAPSRALVARLRPIVYAV